MAQRLWTPADLVGVTGLEIVDATKSVVTSDGTFMSFTPINSVTAQRPAGGTATAIVSFRDDFRPVIGSFNGQQTIYFGTDTRQLDIPTKTNLPNGTGDKFWFEVVKVLETRTDDRYTWGYGGSSQTAAAYKLRQGAVPYADVGSTGYAIGSVAVASSGISIITEQYTQADTTSRASYNGNATPTAYKATRNSSLSQAAHFGNWPLYGNGSSHHLMRRGWGYGSISVADMQRLQGWASWDAGDAGASLVDGHPYKAAAPTIDDGTGGATASGGSALAGISVTATAAVATAGVGATTLQSMAIVGVAKNATSAMLAAALAPIVITALASSSLSAGGTPALGAAIGAGTGSNAPIVSAQGIVSLSAIAVAGAGGGSTASGGGAQLALLAGSGVCGVPTRGAAVGVLNAIVPAGAAGAAIVGRAATQLGLIQLVGRAAGVTSGSGGTNFAPIAGAGEGSPPAPPIIVAAGRQMILTTAGSRRLTLTATGSRRLTI